MVSASTAVEKGRSVAASVDDPIIAKQLRDICDIIEEVNPLIHND